MRKGGNSLVSRHLNLQISRDSPQQSTGYFRRHSLMGLDIWQRIDDSFLWGHNQIERQDPMLKRLYSKGFPAVSSGNRKTINPRARWRRRRRFLVRALVLAAAVQGGAWGVAAADDQVARAATASIAPAVAERSNWEDGLSFETSAHRAWYNVFWTGKCSKLPFFDRLTCLKGRPTWAEVTQMVLAKAQPDARTAMHVRMIRLGRMIGHEWARHNDDRRIDSDDLVRWSEWLKKSADVSGAVDRMAESVQSKLVDR